MITYKAILFLIILCIFHPVICYNIDKCYTNYIMSYGGFRYESKNIF